MRQEGGELCHIIHFVRIDPVDTAGPGFRLLLENVHHFTDGCDAGKRFLGKGKGIGNRSNQFVVDVNRAATHSGEDSGAGNRTTGEPCQDHILFRPHVFQDTQNLNLEGVDPGPFEDCLSVSRLSRLDRFQRIKFNRLADQGKADQEK